MKSACVFGFEPYINWFKCYVIEYELVLLLKLCV